jgi:hypothetical protein
MKCIRSVRQNPFHFPSSQSLVPSQSVLSLNHHPSFTTKRHKADIIDKIKGTMTANKKIADMKSEMRIPTNTHHLSSEWGVKQNSHDIWLQASTDDRQGPLLLEDNHAREKVRFLPP